MDPGVVAAIIAGFLALLVALVTAWSTHKNTRDMEELRHAHRAIERLRSATGALRLELFLSTRSFARRLGFYYPRLEPVRAKSRGASPRAYHEGGLLIFRMLRPLTISCMIEQQTFYGDTLIEPTIVELLRFNHAAFEMLTGDRLGEGPKAGERFPGFNMQQCWDHDQVGVSEPVPPFQRVRASYLRSAAAALLVPPEGGPKARCMMHHEFVRAWEHPEEKENASLHAALEPVKEVIDGFSPKNSPVFWLRLVGYAYVCARFHEGVREDALSAGINYTPLNLKVPELLRAVDVSKQARTLASDGLEAQRRYVAEHADVYKDLFETVRLTAL